MDDLQSSPVCPWHKMYCHVNSSVVGRCAGDCTVYCSEAYCRLSDSLGITPAPRPPAPQVCDSPFSWQCVVQNIALPPPGINLCRAQAFAALGVPAPTAEQYATFSGGISISGALTK